MDVSFTKVKRPVALVTLHDNRIIFANAKLAYQLCSTSSDLIFYEASVTLNLTKCEFFTKCIDYLSHVILPGRIEVLKGTVDDIHWLLNSTTVKGLGSFMDLSNLFSGFVPRFFLIAARLKKSLVRVSHRPSTDLPTRKLQPWTR